MIQGEKKYLWAEPIVAWGSFAILLTLYWLTVAPTVSYWDCPEYVTAAYLLEVGHPPGNPTWMLVERIVTMFAPSPEYAALLVNLSSGLFTAFAAFFLAVVSFFFDSDSFDLAFFVSDFFDVVFSFAAVPLICCSLEA